MTYRDVLGKEGLRRYRITRVIPTIIHQTNNAAYAEAIKLIRKVGGLMKKQKQLLQYEHYLAELRVQFKLKRNFIKLLDGVAWNV